MNQSNTAVDDTGSPLATEEPAQPTNGQLAAAEQARGPNGRGVSFQSKAHRRLRWEWNRRLLIVSAATVAIVAAAGAGSYFWQSSQTGDAFLQRAEAARTEGDHSEEAKWLGRYILLEPEDVDAQLRLALAADEAAVAAPAEKQLAKSQEARRQLSAALSRLGGGAVDPELLDDLRRRLVQRLLELGPAWAMEAERQIVRLDAPRNDPDATRWLARALDSQVRAELYQERVAADGEKETDYWAWLADQPVGEVLALAVERNPGDVDIAALYLDAYQLRPEQFPTTGDAAADRSPGPRYLSIARDTVRRLEQQDDSSRAKLLAAQYWQRDGDLQKSRSLLVTAAERARADLQEAVSKSPAADEDPPADGEAGEELRWDYLLILETAGELARLETEPSAEPPSETDLQKAADYYELLTGADLRSIPSQYLERAYLGAGQVQRSLGNLDQAYATWKEGVGRLATDSIPLLRSIATTRLQTGDEESVREAVSNYADAVNDFKLQVSQTPRQSVSRAGIEELRSRASLAEWDLLVLRGNLASLQGQTWRAIELLRRAMDTQLSVDANTKVGVARELAQRYSEAGYHDLAASTLERAIRLDPGNDQLRLAAADAWQRAGNEPQATQQRNTAGQYSFASLLSEAQRELSRQLALEPERRSLATVRQTLERASGLLDNVERNAPSGQNSEQIDDARWRVDYLRALIPDSADGLETNVAPERITDTIQQLTERYPESQSLHAFAAARLSAAEADEKARAARDRLAELAGEDSAAVAVVDAQMLAANDEAAEAAKRLIRHAQQSEDDAVRLLPLAARFARQADDAERAHRILQSALERTESQADRLGILTELAEIAPTLPKDSKLFDGDAAAASPEQLSQHWEEEIRKLEGDQGTLWRLARAKRLIRERLTRQGGGNAADAQWNDVEQLAEQILARRPNWNEALALAGRIAYLQGDIGESIEQLRRAIDAGDKQFSTWRLLAAVLDVSGRDDEANRILDEAAQLPGASAAEINRMSARIAVGQRDFRKALEEVRKIVAENPGDVIARQQVAAYAASILSSEPRAEDREALLELARNSLDEARKRSGDENHSVYWDRYLLEANFGTAETRRSALEAIEKSSLPEADKFLVLGRAHMHAQDYGEAESAFRKAEAAAPDRVETQLRLAELYGATKRRDQQIDRLERALKLDPPTDNAEKIRSQLALTMALEGGSNIDWDRIGELLSRDSGGSENNELVLALMLSVRGDRGQQERAAEMLREMRREEGGNAKDAARLLAALYRRWWTEDSGSGTSEEKQQWLSDAKSIYRSLTESRDAAPVDLYRFADLLIAELNRVLDPELTRLKSLRAGDTQPDEEALAAVRDSIRQKAGGELRRIRELDSRLRRTETGAVAALDVRLRLNELEGKPEQPNQIINGWAQEHGDGGGLGSAQASSLAGQSLMRLGFPDDATRWLKQSYEADPSTLANYAVALVRAERHDEAQQVCLRHFREHRDAVSATLLAEAVMAEQSGGAAVTDEIDAVFQEAVGKFPANPALLEGVATVRLQQGNLQEALRLYQVVEKLAPERIRTLNNLAMVYAQLPGQASKGIAPIERALEQAPDNPELLDTKGTVLLKAGKLGEAQATFVQALNRLDEPRFRFHLIQSLRAQGLDAAAESQWRDLDLENLDRSGLTPAERDELDTMIKQYDAVPVS